MGNTVTVGETRNIADAGSRTFEERQQELDQARQKEEAEAKRNRFSPFTDWYQINKQYTDQLIWLAGASPKASQLLQFLLSHMDNYNALMCSYSVLEDALNVSTSTIQRAVAFLREHQFIQVVKSGTSNIYHVNKNIAWNSWGTNHKYAKFAANIIVQLNEQDDETKKAANAPEQLSLIDDISAERHKKVYVNKRGKKKLERNAALQANE